MGHPQAQLWRGVSKRTQEEEQRREARAFDRKSPPFAEEREGWGTLKSVGGRR
jgi:hypothetical protein